MILGTTTFYHFNLHVGMLMRAVPPRLGANERYCLSETLNYQKHLLQNTSV